MSENDKQEIFETLKENILDILEDEVEEKDITIEKSMLDMGASSLDIIQIVSNTMRELKIKIPREELSKLKNIEELVDKMVEYKNAA